MGTADRHHQTLETPAPPRPCGADEALAKAVHVVADAARERELEAQLAHAKKLEVLGRLAGGVAHDFNNLLEVILSLSTLVLEKPLEGEELADSVREIKAAAELAAALTRRLLAFSRKQVLEPEVFKVDGVVEGTTRLIRRLLGEGVELEVSLATEVGYVRMDPAQLEQLLVNVAVNARDAMPAGGRLEISASNVEVDGAAARRNPDARPGPHVRLRVTDTGTGMAPDVVQRIFEPFFTTKPDGKGTGLGLAKVYGAVVESGGHVDVRSEPGRGTTFDFYFPRVVEPGSVPRLAAVVSEDATGLVVEDDGLVRRALLP
ncbi:MAG: ATP-binding protein [Myxococcales bacterium]